MTACSVIALGIAACGGSTTQAQQSSSNGGGNGTSADTGIINATLRLPSGTASTASYTLTGPNSFNRSSMQDFPDVQEVAFYIADVPAGTGYMLTVLASSGDSGEACNASTMLDVTANQTNNVDLVAQCTGAPPVPTGYGALDVWATLPAGVSLASAECVLTGPAGVEAQSPLKVSGSSSLHFQLNNIPAGKGQMLTINANGVGGTMMCSAMSTFDILPNKTSETTLLFRCEATPSGGAGH
jgi:hypothetical protein